MILIWQNNTVNILFHLPFPIHCFYYYYLLSESLRKTCAEVTLYSSCTGILYHETSEYSARCSHNLPIIGTCGSHAEWLSTSKKNRVLTVSHYSIILIANEPLIKPTPEMCVHFLIIIFLCGDGLIKHKNYIVHMHHAKRNVMLIAIYISSIKRRKTL